MRKSGDRDQANGSHRRVQTVGFEDHHLVNNFTSSCQNATCILFRLQTGRFGKVLNKSESCLCFRGATLVKLTNIITNKLLNHRPSAHFPTLRRHHFVVWSLCFACSYVFNLRLAAGSTTIATCAYLLHANGWKWRTLKKGKRNLPLRKNPSTQRSVVNQWEKLMPHYAPKLTSETTPCPTLGCNVKRYSCILHNALMTLILQRIGNWE